ncbi:MAG: EamA family transporter [Candidatus Saccharibacteria bacterium]|nr:EamA family transporter [Candidatus Saccharibacteria bacterium]
MLWLILAIINAAGYAICGFFDNYITDVVFKGKKQESIKIFYGISYLITAAALFFIFGYQEMELGRIAWLLAAGVLSSTASIPYYRALKDEETTTASVFLQLTPVIYLIADSLIFKVAITPIQILAFFVIIMAPIVIVVSRRRKRSRKLELSAAGGFLAYVVLAATSGVITAHAGEGFEFTTTFSWFVIGRGIMDLIYYFAHPDWRKRYQYIHKHDKKRLYWSLSAAQGVFLIAEFAGRYALIIGTPALVSVTSNALEMIIVFVLGIILSIIVPKFGREKLSRHIVLAHLVATILAVIGIIMLQ